MVLPILVEHNIWLDEPTREKNYLFFTLGLNNQFIGRIINNMSNLYLKVVYLLVNYANTNFFLENMMPQKHWKFIASIL